MGAVNVNLFIYSDLITNKVAACGVGSPPRAYPPTHLASAGSTPTSPPHLTQPPTPYTHFPTHLASAGSR
jgi:hypothetical protein